MSISIDPHDGGPIEGIFGTQLEQRVGHVDREEDDGLGHRRRRSEGRESIHSNPDQRLIHASSQGLEASSPNHSRSLWPRVPWRSWRLGSSSATTYIHKPQLHSSHKTTSQTWWPSRLYTRLSLQPTTAGLTGPSIAVSNIRHLRSYIWTLLAAVVSNKRRKSWFLSLILISLGLTVFSGGYLLTQLQHHKDLVPSQSPSIPQPADDGSQLSIPLQDGPRRDRNRGKKLRVPKLKPAGQTDKGNTITKDIPKTKGNTTENKGTKDPKNSDSDINTENGSSIDLRLKKNSTEQGLETAERPPNTTTTEEFSNVRLCNLEDMASGRWVHAKADLLAQERAGSDLHLSWTGYGPSGCRPNIWNERYLLAPSIANNSSTTEPSHGTTVQRDWDYARHLIGYRWQLNRGEAARRQPTVEDCRQPEMDIVDLVEVLKRSPLLMIGDKFLEQEFLTLECMIMGMQDQLLIDTRQRLHEKHMQQELLEAMDYWIEEEWPSVIELKIAPAASIKASPSSMPSTPPTAKSPTRPNIYRKAKPGYMKLIDRLSNTTLVTFVRSDVLWDSKMMAGQVAKHAIKSVAELSTLDAGGLHPDCKLVGSVVMCESPHIGIHKSNPEDVRSTKQTSSSSFWTWLVRDDRDSVDMEEQHDQNGGTDAGEMSVGSDLDRDMINLEWVSVLEEMVQDSTSYRDNTKAEGEQNQAVIERKPMVLLSNGHFWEYDPADAIDVGQRGKRGLSKVEQDVVRASQERRRKLLRKRYTMVLTNVLGYIKATYPDVRVMVQTSVKGNPCRAGLDHIEEKRTQDMKDQEAALLNALTKTVVARMQDPLYSFMDTTFLRLFKEVEPTKHRCDSFTMPGRFHRVMRAEAYY
ncbi:hypothetical protein BGX28_004603 [Mortierella sp. GBA30]|nr:hypothetical protein BGX28_004603 [Mortierella sp. GBA30]